MKNLFKMNIVIPMAGLGTRIKIFDIDIPKPLLKINDKYMIEHALESLNIDARFIFITRKYNNSKYNEILSEILKKNKSNYIEIKIDEDQHGAAHSALYAKEYINNDDPLIILNCDQKINWDPIDFLNFIDNTKCDGAVVVFNSNDDKYSYAKTIKNKIIDIQEKIVISNNALAGIHYWKHGKDFIESAEKLLNLYYKKNIKECYISNTYSFLLKNKNILIYKIDDNAFFNLGDMEGIYQYNKIFNPEFNNRGKSGAFSIVLGEKTIKIGNDRVGEQGKWIYNNYNKYLPKVNSFLNNSYVMETLNKFELNTSKEDFIKELVLILQNHFWINDCENFIDDKEHVKKLYDICYSFNIYDKMIKIKKNIEWNDLTKGKIHGDPIFDNIMFKNNIIIIDPLPSTPAIPDLISVDLGKILQSVMGYENDIYFDNRLKDCDINVLKNIFSKEDWYASKYWCIFHFLRTLKYLNEEELKKIKNKIEYLIDNFENWG